MQCPFSSRALFLGLSNNPHITDLQLDISACEVRAPSAHAAKAPFIHGSPRPMPASILSYHVPPLSVFPWQLRSAGAGVLQELFPRVSCVGTLDISDNGKTHSEALTACLPSLGYLVSLFVSLVYTFSNGRTCFKLTETVLFFFFKPLL